MSISIWLANVFPFLDLATLFQNSSYPPAHLKLFKMLNRFLVPKKSCGAKFIEESLMYRKSSLRNRP